MELEGSSGRMTVPDRLQRLRLEPEASLRWVEDRGRGWVGLQPLRLAL